MPKKMTKEEWLSRAIYKHHDKYDYSDVVFINSKTPVKIKCILHNTFFNQIAGNHLYNQGCPTCGNIRRQSNNIKRNSEAKENFIVKAQKIHGDRYNYSKVKYKRNSDKVRIICKIHGEFLQAPRDHLSGSGCNRCGIARNVSSQTLTTEEFIIKANIVHKGIYEYSNVKYINAKTKVDIFCKKCNSIFSQDPDHHVNSKCGCPYCNAGRFKLDAPSILYYFKITFENKILYKIGITNRTITQRYNSYDRSRIKVISETYFELGQLALNEEKMIKNEFKHLLYHGDTPFTDGTGTTEVFTVDVLGLD